MESAHIVVEPAPTAAELQPNLDENEMWARLEQVMENDREAVSFIINIHKYQTCVENKRMGPMKKMEAMEKFVYLRNMIVAMMDESSKHNDVLERCLPMIDVWINKGREQCIRMPRLRRQGSLEQCPTPAEASPRPAPTPAPTPKLPAPTRKRHAPTPERPALAPERHAPTPERPALDPERPAHAPQRPALARKRPNPDPERLPASTSSSTRFLKKQNRPGRAVRKLLAELKDAAPDLKAQRVRELRESQRAAYLSRTANRVLNQKP